MEQKSFTVLILDEEPDLAETLERVLQRYGYKTVVATESTRALDCVERERPDLVLLDPQMPGLDGMLFLEQLRSRRWAMPVIMLTAFATAEAAVEAMQQGANDYLAKSSSPAELLLKVRKFLP